MKSLIRWAIGNSPAMNTILIGMLLVGGASLASLRREVFPEFELEILLITVPYPGASPEEVEEGICQKIEESVQSLDGIKKKTAIAKEGSGFVILELQPHVDVQKVLSEVRSELDQIPSFPELSEDYEVQQITFRSPAIRVGVLGPDRDDENAEWDLRDVTEDVRTELLQLEPAEPSNPISKILSIIRPRAGNAVVSTANILTEKPYQIDIEISEATLREYGLSLQQVAGIVRRQNLELPGGRLKTDAQEMLLVGKGKRTLGRDIEDITIITKPSGDKLTVGDLGQVRDGFADESLITRIDGREGLVIEVARTSSEDLLEVVESVRAYAAKKEMPPGYELKLWYDQSVDVRDRMNMLVRNGLQGLLLVFLVLAIFLELRLAFWVALGIPVAVMGAGCVLLGGDQTLNMLSMFAFLMALGIVVDDAIVIGENIYHHRQLGKKFVQAATDGTYEVLPSVCASVTTTIIAFMPLMFVAGVMGKFIAVMPLAVIAMLIISLLESTFILPCHLAHHDNLFFRIIGVCFYPLKVLVTFFHWVNAGATRAMRWTIDRVYTPMLDWSLSNPLIVVSSAAALFIMAIGFVKAGITPFVIMPKLDNRFIEAVITYPDGTPAIVTDQATISLEETIKQINAAYIAEMKEKHPDLNDEQREERGLKLIEVRHRSVGMVQQQSPANPNGSASGAHMGAVMIELVAPDKRDIKSQQILDQWRDQAAQFPGAESCVFRSPAMGPAAVPIEFKVLADRGFEHNLEAAAEQCKERLKKFEGVFDIDDDSRPGKWELQLNVKQDADGMAVTLADLAETVRGSYYGEEVMRLQRGRHEVKLMVRNPPAERRSMANFEDIRVRGADAVERPMTEVADVRYKRGTSEINRIDQLRSITVLADVDENSGANAKVIMDTLKESGFAEKLAKDFPGIRIRWEGQDEQTQESMQSMFVGFFIAMLAMYVLLTVEFRSYIQPLMILAIIPFGLIGAIAGHAIFQMNLTLFSVFGLIALTGVVVNDSIVLVDFINTRVRAGGPLKEALLDAGQRRFRAVFLTSVTTVAGLIPLLMERSFQAQVLIPMATSLCFGLILATALVLLLVPTFYYLYARMILGLNGDTGSVSRMEPIEDARGEPDPAPVMAKVLHP